MRRERGRTKERREGESWREERERERLTLTDIWALFPNILHPLGATLVKR